MPPPLPADLARRMRSSRAPAAVRPLWPGLGLVLLAGAAGAQHAPPQGARPDSMAGSPDRPWPSTVYVTLSNVFDSNINHTEEGLDSYGTVAGFGGRYRERWADFTLELACEAFFRHYSATDQWNRPAYEASVSVTQRVARHWSLGLTGEGSINGSTEDRVLRNEYSIEPLLEYRFNSQNRLRVYGEYFVKLYPEPTGQNALDPRVGAQFRQLLGEDRTWGLGARYEINRADSTRFRYAAWTFSADAANPIGTSGKVSLQVLRRVRQYTSRLVKVGDTDVLRRDDGWVATVAYEYSAWKLLDVGLTYQYEQYNSNDARREFRDHTIVLTWTRRW